MTDPRFSETEAERLLALDSFQILDTPSETGFDDFVQLAAALCGTPMAMVSLVDAERQWFKAKLGTTVPQTPRDISFCTHVVSSQSTLVVPDALLDARFAANPLVVDGPRIRFYAGAPLCSREGHVLGSLCVIDHVPRELTPQQIGNLEALGRRVVDLMELRRHVIEVKEVGQQLRAQSQQIDFLRQIFRNTNASLLIAEVKENGFPVVSVNPAFERLTGYKAEEVVGGDSFFLRGPETDQKALQTVQEAMAEGRECSVIIKNYRKNGESFWNEWSLTPVVCDDGMITHFLGSHRDVTDFLDTRDLILRQQQTMVQSARLSALGEMAAGIAHEINNPLTIINGHATNLAEIETLRENPGEVLRRAQIISKTALRISKIVKALRGLSRAQDNEEMKWVSTEELIQDALDLCQEKFKGAGISLNVVNHCPEERILVRPTQISQVLLNLFNNSFDAVRDSSQKLVEVQVSRDLKGLSLSVLDTGHGVPKEFEMKIMQPFFTTKPLGQGTGIGLSLSKSIMESHEGHFFFDRRDDRTCFTMFFPRKLVESLESPIAS